MKERTRAALVAGAVLSAAVVRDRMARAIDRSLVGTALDREAPKIIGKWRDRLSGSGSRADVEELLAGKQAAMEAAPHRIVELESFDGTRLVGHFFLPEHPRRALVAMHGWRSGWSRDFCLVSDFLREQDCAVLYAEQRGQGSSDGDYMGFGMIERYDCREWIRWMNANGCADLPLYLAGISMGASTVLMTSGFPDLPENVTGILADCGFTSAREEWQHISEHNLHIPFRRHRKHVDDLCRRRIDLNTDAYSTLDAMKTNRIPILFVHGSGDTFVPMEMTLANYEACTAPKRLLIAEGAGHGMSYLADPAAYRQAVLDFWSELESPAE